ncbi:MAG: helix-turn-helix transcriptional regulator [Nocardiopsaceae bacterium]|nr:helix-turn-helix transcriptional regulator [Nocardiopsaceae bacterium]
MTGIPPVRRRLLGAALRRYREGLGYSLDDAARILECDRSKVSRIETGHRGIRDKELRELLTEYGVAAGEADGLVAVAHAGRQQGWWQGYRDVLGEAGQDFVIMEAAATEILGYEPHRVPALLQTAGYAQAVADADPAFSDDSQRDHAVEVTLTRQQVVLAERHPRVELLVGESALHQSVGGAGVMRGQLARLAAVAGDGPDAGVTLRVLPFRAGAHAAAGCGGMTILRFAAAPGIGVIHLDALSGGISLDGPGEVARYLRAFTRLRLAALAPAASARLLREAARGQRAA